MGEWTRGNVRPVMVMGVGGGGVCEEWEMGLLGVGVRLRCGSGGVVVVVDRWWEKENVGKATSAF